MTSSPFRWLSGLGTAQQQRLPQAVSGEYFRVDERGMADLIASSAALAESLRFFNLQRIPEGTWGNWIRNEEAFLLQLFAGIDVDRLAAEFLGESSGTAEWRILRFRDLAKRIYAWYEPLRALVDRPAGVAVSAEIMRLVEAHSEYGRFAVAMAHADDNEAIELFRTSLTQLRGAEVAGGEASDASAVRNLFFSFLNAVAHVRERASEQLTASLASDTHEPSAGLFLAFLQLFGVVQKRINEFTSRHTDFYYRECLRMAPRRAQSDRVHFVCERVSTPELAVSIPKGTVFSLRNAAGRSIAYQADEDVEVTAVRVGALYTLRLERDLRISPERELDYVTRAKAWRLPVDTVGSSATVHWPLFGGGADRTPNAESHDARLGIIVSSPLLLLHEGRREVRARICFAHPADIDPWLRAEISDRRVASDRDSRLRAEISDRRVAPVAGRKAEQLVDLVTGAFLRFAQLDQRAEDPHAVDDEMEIFSLTHSKAVGVGARPAEAIAAQVLIRRLKALSMAKAWELSEALKIARNTTTVLTAWELSPASQVDIRREMEHALGTGLQISFETEARLIDGVQLLVNGRNWLSGEAHEMARQAVPELGGSIDQCRLYSLYLFQRILRAPRQRAGYRLFGRLFCRWMLLDPHALNADYVLQIRQALTTMRVAGWLAKLSESDKSELRSDLIRARNVMIVRSASGFTADQQTQLRLCARHAMGTQIDLKFGIGSQNADGLEILVNQRDWLAHLPRPDESADASVPNRADILGLLKGDHFPAREILVGRLLGDLFDVGFTAAGGWYVPADAFVVSSDPTRPEVSRDMVVVARLPPEAPPVVACEEGIHGDGCNVPLPSMRLRIKPDGAMYCYSLLSDLMLTDIHLEVSVHGVREAVLYNHLGRLDPSKPFNPFGPLPSHGAYMVFGNAEIAGKDIDSLDVNIEWGNLPQDGEGFSGHYRGYDPGFSNQAFKVVPSILCRGSWEPRDGTGAQSLFTGPVGGRVAPRCTISIDGASLRNFYRPLSAAGNGADFGFDASTRSGFFRLVLAEPAQAFGHAQYPQLLTGVLSRNARLKRPQPLPNAPYTPLIERLTFDYRASTAMHFLNDEADERIASGDRVLLLHPFGWEEVYPSAGSTSKGPIPQIIHEGNLCIGLTAADKPGRITLLFSLRDESARGNAGDATEPRTAWSYLVSNRWRSLHADRVISNTTHGFLTSGIVTLDIPDDIDCDNTVFPPGYYWLCVSAESVFERFAGLYGVRAQAFSATRVPEPSDAPQAAASDGTSAQPQVSIPGLLSVVQRGDAFGGRVAEQTTQFITRAGERLRHKNRAMAPWDYERLVLEQFPQVHMVKCFAATRGHASATERDVPLPSPGSVTLAIVPASSTGALQATRAPKLNAVELDGIRDYIRERTSPFADIVVRNVMYERILVRCAVRLNRGVASGRCLQQMNQDIVDRISPWRPGGLGTQFNWTLRKEEVEAWIRKFDYVDSVAGLSLLQIAEDDDGYFTLDDSARYEVTDGRQSRRDTAHADLIKDAKGALRPHFPWSIAIPAQRHVIELMKSPQVAQATGIAGLEIGSSFIIAGEQNG